MTNVKLLTMWLLVTAALLALGYGIGEFLFRIYPFFERKELFWLVAVISVLSPIYAAAAYGDFIDRRKKQAKETKGG